MREGWGGGGRFFSSGAGGGQDASVYSGKL